MYPIKKQIDLNESIRFDNDVNPYSLNSEWPSSQTQIQDISRDDYNQNQNLQTQKKSLSNDKFNTSQSKNQDKLGLSIVNNIKDKIIISSLKFKSQRDTIQFICFNDRKIIMKNAQIQQFILQKQQNLSSRVILCNQILEKVIKILFYQQNMFQIMNINLKSFNMTYTVMENGSDNKTSQKNINNQPLQKIFNYQQININRSIRSQKVNMQYKQKKPQEQQLLILSPDLIDFIYYFDKNKTFLELKEAIQINYYQFIGKIIFVSYHNFQIINMNKRICDVLDKTLQIYQEKRPAYVDKNILQDNIEPLKINQNYNIVNSAIKAQINFSQIMIGQTMLKGQVFLRIEKYKIIQRFDGGFFKYFYSIKQKIRSLIILTGMKFSENQVHLQFKYKDHKQIVKYFFKDIIVMNSFITTILTITRIFNHKLQILQ